MRVKINNTVEVTEDERARIACVLDQKIHRRSATRDEARDYIWMNGSDWQMALADAYFELANEELI